MDQHRIKVLCLLGVLLHAVCDVNNIIYILQVQNLDFYYENNDKSDIVCL